MIRNKEELADEILDIYRQNDLGITTRESYVHRAVADYREFQEELEGFEDDSDCLGGACKL